MAGEGPKDLTDKYGSGNEGSSVADFPPPSADSWEKYDAGLEGLEDGSEADDAGADDQVAADLATAEASKEDAEPEAEAAPADDVDIALPDGTTMKLSELNALRAGKAPAAAAKPVTEAQTFAQQKADFQRQQQEFKDLQEKHRQGIEEILKDPEKYKALQREAGVSLEPNPVRDQQKWVQFRYNQYLQVGWKPEEITREKLTADLMQAQHVSNTRELETLRSTLDTQRREVDDRKHYDSVSKELEGLYARPEFAHAATPEGRVLVDALLAQADRDGVDADLAELVGKANDYGARLIEKYVGVKKGHAKATGPLLRGGGSHRAPEPKDYGSGYDGFGKIARDRMKTGA